MMAGCNVMRADEILKSENGFLAFSESFADPIIVVSEQGRIAYCNRACLNLLGYSYDELLDTPVNSLFSYNDFKDCRAVENKNPVEPHEKYTLIMNGCFVHKNRTWLSAEVTICPVHIGERSLRAMVCRFATRPNTVDDIDISAQASAQTCALVRQRLIGTSSAICRVHDMIGLVAKTDSSVLITGESGSGKELVAEALHAASPRADRPLVKLNCSALPETLLESELFGHVKGSFTGAIKDTAGRFEVAHGGTLFLDEIGDVAPAIQVKLLRVLESQEFNRIGESKPIKVDVRIIAATNQDLPVCIMQRRFREDLYYRLKVIEIQVPPLRERIEDIPLLVSHFLPQLNRKLNKSVLGVSDEALAFFSAYSWPGNVREMAHALEHASIVCQNGFIGLHHLPPELQKRRVMASILPGQNNLNDAKQLCDALAKTGGNKARAARLLGIDRKTLYRHIKKYNTLLSL